MPNKSSVTKRSDKKPTKKIVRGCVGKTSSSLPKESLFKKDISLHLSERIGILRKLKYGWIRLYRRYKALFGKHTIVRFFTSVVLLVVIFFGTWAVLETIEYKVMEHRLNSLTDSIVDVLGEPDERAVTKGCYATPDSFGTTGMPRCGYSSGVSYSVYSKEQFDDIFSKMQDIATNDPIFGNDDKVSFIEPPGSEDDRIDRTSRSWSYDFARRFGGKFDCVTTIALIGISNEAADPYKGAKVLLGEYCTSDALFYHYPSRH
jgi:hypothetical protein